MDKCGENKVILGETEVYKFLRLIVLQNIAMRYWRSGVNNDSRRKSLKLLELVVL